MSLAMRFLQFNNYLSLKKFRWMPIVLAAIAIPTTFVYSQTHHLMETFLSFVFVGLFLVAYHIMLFTYLLKSSGLRYLIWLCQQNADLVVTFDEARTYGMCFDGLVEFRETYFSRHKNSITLVELVPFIEYYHKEWRSAVVVCMKRLHAAGLIGNLRSAQYFAHPRARITKELAQMIPVK